MPAATDGASASETRKEYYSIDSATGEMLFPSTSAFEAYASHAAKEYESNKKNSGKVTMPCMYIYKGLIYSAAKFSHVHPGGVQVMAHYHGKDITQVFHDEHHHHAHTATAVSILQQYRVGKISEVKSGVAGQLRKSGADTLTELTAYPQITQKYVIYKDFLIRRDRGLVWQVMFLSLPQYMHLIDTPIYLPDCRLFDSSLIELFSRTKHWVIMVLWLPLSFFWVMRGVMRDYTQLNPAWSSRFDVYLYYPNRNWVFGNYPAPVNPSMTSYIPPNATDPRTIAEAQYRHAAAVSDFSPFFVLVFFLLGVGLWSLMEYSIHRFVFHFERRVPQFLLDNPLSKQVHLLLHGIHHVIPMDPDRLVFPPAMFAVACAVLYWCYSYVMTGSCLDVVSGGAVFGYVLYDEVHYYIHHCDPTSLYLKNLRKYHHAHHYIDNARGYGITNTLWDQLLGTAH